MKKAKRKSAGARIIAGLTEFVEALERGESVESRFTVRTCLPVPLNTTCVPFGRCRWYSPPPANNVSG